MAPRRGLALALPAVLLIAGVGLAGCLGGLPDTSGVVVTSQPLLDAFHVLDEGEELSAVPDWVIVDEPLEADRVGRPFVIEAEEVTRLGPELVLDQPHPLVTGPSRQALSTGLDEAGIEHRSVPTEPRFATVEATLAAAGQATGTSHEQAWQDVRQQMAQLNETLADEPRPRAVFLFPAGLVAGEGTDADLVLELAGMENAAAQAGLEGYAQITSEALQRVQVERVIATATMHVTPQEIANRPMFSDTPIEDSPERVLVVDPSRTTRLGPHLPQAAEMLATWSHANLSGPQVSVSVDPYEVQACQQTAVETPAPNATVRFLGERYEPGEITVPDVDEGHYRVHVDARDGTGTATMETMISVEGSACE